MVCLLNPFFLLISYIYYDYIGTTILCQPQRDIIFYYLIYSYFYSLILQTYIKLQYDDNQNSLKIMFNFIKKNCVLNIKASGLISCLSLATMTLLIFASITIITIISVTPIIILGIGQLPSGQRDIILQPRGDYLNASRAQQILKIPVLPRIQTFLGLDDHQGGTGWLMDFSKERQNHLGTIGGNEPLNHSYVYLHEGFKKTVGQKVIIGILDTNILFQLSNMIYTDKFQISENNKQQALNQVQWLIRNPTAIRGQFQVIQNFDTAAGKFGIGQVNNYIYLDIKYCIQQMINYTYLTQNKDISTSPLIKAINHPQFSFAQLATQATVNLPNRIKVYSNPDYDASFKQLSRYGHQVMDKLGLFSVTSNMPIANNLTNLGFVGMFIGVMFKLVIFSLFVLSAIMMNNMLLMGTQRTNFDFALLKLMGANRLFVISNILFGSLKYVGLSNIVAYPMSYFALQAVTNVFQDFFGYKYQITPTSDAIMGGLFIGVLVPVVASITPIWGVIKNDLAQNLNPLRNKTEATKFQVYIQGKQFPYGKTFFGGIAMSYGLMIYYLLPRALINQNLGLLLTVFFIILQGLLLGLILLSYSFQYLFEKLVAKILLFWTNTTDYILTLKNLSSHRFKNRRTSIMYSLSVSFIIFVSVGLQIQLQTVYTQILKARGSYVTISGNNVNRTYYDAKLTTIQGVQDWAYITETLQGYMKKKGSTRVMISDMARLFFTTDFVRGISPNLINTFFYEKVSYLKTQAEYPYDPYSYLYSPNGLMTCTIGLYAADRFGILQGNNHQFLINIYYPNGVKQIPLNYTTVFDKRMGLLYTRLPVRQQIGVSFDTFKQLAGIPYDQQVPISQIKIKLKNKQQAKIVGQRLRMSARSGDSVWDYTELKDTIDKIDRILSIIMVILLTIVLIISFFSLLTTTYVNILNQTNEIAILMILGYQKIRIVKIYIYQSMVLVLNSCIIGLVVGYVVAQMMGLQRQLFSELPIDIHIDGLPLLFIITMISSLLSTIKPLRQIFSNTISQILNYAC